MFLLAFGDFIIQVACGSKHSIVLGRNGNVWGCGLGVSGWEDEQSDNSDQNASLIYHSPVVLRLNAKGKGHKDDTAAITKICAGVAHSLALASETRLLPFCIRGFS